MRLLVAIIGLISAINVDISNQCSCSYLTQQDDCNSKFGCKWHVLTSICTDNSSQDLVTSYCHTITNSTQCASTKGCAFIDSKCSIFAGCSVYKGIRDADCQAISTQCNSNGTYCQGQLCSAFTTTIDCEKKRSISGSGSCVWENKRCRDQKCSEADPSLNTDILCNSYLLGCITNGFGCVERLYSCSTYNSDLVDCKRYIGYEGQCDAKKESKICQPRMCDLADQSYTTNAECQTYKSDCVTTGQGCKNFKVSCTEAPKSFKTNEACQEYQGGCITNGAGCMNSPFTCDKLLSSTTCLQDYWSRPCLWQNDKCQQYYKCEDLSFATADKCQDFQNTCIPIKLCSYYNTRSECSVGVDGTCIWADARCSIFDGNCRKVSTQDCQLYNTFCLQTSAGCYKKKYCSEFSSQNDCLYGIDGKCNFVTQNSECRMIKCEDLRYKTHSACFSQNIEKQMKCTTNGINCIPLQSCQTYASEIGCVISNSNTPCMWTTTGSCIEEIKSCSEHKTQEHCNTGEKNGTCIFINEQCFPFSNCSDANGIDFVCKSRPQTCFWTNNRCVDQTCETLEMSNCGNIPNFDQTAYTLCDIQDGKCVSLNPVTLAQSECFQRSQYTYSWSPNMQKCTACVQNTTSTVNLTNVTDIKFGFLFSNFFIFAFLN